MGINLLSRVGLLVLLVMPYNEGHRQHNPFISFDVELNGAGSVNVRWSTFNRAKNVRFEIERSAGQKIWNTISVINSDARVPYNFIDEHPERGINYYRIKQIDNSTQYFLSAVKEIYVNKPGRISVWPNPAKDVIHIGTSFTDGTIDIIDVSGQILHKRPVSAFVTDVSLGQLPGGIYFVRVRYDKNKQAVEKFVKE